MLIEYIRDENRNRVGMVVAIDSYRIGWSKVKPRSGDRFNKEMGLKIATGRANIGSTASVPNDVQILLEKMQDRATRYFKDTVVTAEEMLGHEVPTARS